MLSAFFIKREIYTLKQLVLHIRWSDRFLLTGVKEDSLASANAIFLSLHFINHHASLRIYHRCFRSLHYKMRVDDFAFYDILARLMLDCHSPDG